MQYFYKGFNNHSNHKLKILLKKIKPKYTWKDIVLQEIKMNKLLKITNHLKFQSLLYNDMDFNREISISLGTNIFFSGPPGTGKSMAAEIMADELKLGLYKIDLSTAVNKYIGETEKILDKVFNEPEIDNGILFFDEADALFGKRSEVKDSNDRYTNIEISYLIQRIEEYDGITILSTNLRENIDDAFTRRMHFIIEFPFPNYLQREKI